MPENNQNRASKTCKESHAIQTYRVFPADLNPYDTLFGGKIMSSIDDTASIAVSRHCRRAAVTASTDNLDFLHPIHENHSVCVEAYISGVGTSSMEAFAKVIGEDLKTGERYLAATCFMTFVALADDDEQKVIVPNIVPESKEEKMVCDGYEKRRNHRIAEKKINEDFAKTIELTAPWLIENGAIQNG